MAIPNEFEQMKRKVKELEQTVERLKVTQRPENIEMIDDELVLNTSDVDTANITRTYAGSISGSVDAPDYPDKWLIRRHKGKVYLVPAFEYGKK